MIKSIVIFTLLVSAQAFAQMSDPYEEYRRILQQDINNHEQQRQRQLQKPLYRPPTNCQTVPDGFGGWRTVCQ